MPKSFFHKTFNSHLLQHYRLVFKLGLFCRKIVLFEGSFTLKVEKFKQKKEK